jgi:hypothetical protein
METAIFIVLIVFMYGLGMYLGWQARKEYVGRKNESKSNSV